MNAKSFLRGVVILGVLQCGAPYVPAQVLLEYSTFLGGAGDDSAQAVAVAPDGCIWVCGYTYSTNFPVVNPIQAQRQASQDAFISKFSPDGGTLLFSTYLGGSSGDSLAMGIAVDGEGNAYVCGYTDAANFPVLNAFQPAKNGYWTDIFICKLDSSGGLVYSSYLGGSMFDYSYDIAVDTSGCAYVAGRAWSTDFPTVNAFQPTNASSSGYNFTLTKVAADGASLVYSTYLGGTAPSAGHDYPRVAVTPAGIAYFGGATTATNYPVTPNAYQPVHAGPSPGSWDAVVSIFSADGSSLTYSTFLGGSEDIDQAVDIAVGDDGSFTLVGITQSDNFPVVNPIQAAISGQPDLFVTRFNAAGDALEFSTYLGGWDWDYGKAVAVGADGTVVALGLSVSANFPVSGAFQPNNAGSYEAVVAKLTSDGSALEYSTYLGGSGSDFGQAVALDADGAVLVAGQAQSVNFPTVEPWQGSKSGGGDAFVARLAPPDWLQVNEDGFGNSQNFSAFSMAVYSNQLYVGTWNNTDGCGIWRWDGPGSNDWTQVNTDGFGTAQNRGAHSMAVYGGRLYVGTGNSAEGFQVWTYDGAAWSRVASNGLGNAANTFAGSMAVHDGRLYVGAFGTADVFAYDGATWAPANAGEFGNANNDGVRSLAVYDGKLYAGTYNTTDLAELYRYDGPTAADWTLVSAGGFGGNFVEFRSLAAYNGKLYIGGAGWSTTCQVWEYDGSSLVRNDPGGAMQHDSARSMTVFRDKLYVGTGNDSGTPSGGQVWAYDGASGVWQQINENGFGDPANEAVHSLQGHGNELFAGVANSDGAGGKVFRLGWDARIDRVTPSAGALGGGYEVVIDGWNLSDGTAGDVTDVTLCGVSAAVTGVSGSTQVVVEAGSAPATATGDVRVVSASCGETVKSNAFTYEGGAITNVFPGAANVGGGIEVLIQGVGLGNGSDITNVSLAGAAAIIVTQGVNEVTVTAGAATAAVTGDVRVVSTSGGVMILADAFEYLWLDAPVQLDPVDITPSNLTARWELVPAATAHFLDAGTDTNFAAYHPGYEKLDVAMAEQYAVEGLADGNWYAIRLFAWNAHGLSRPSRTVWVPAGTNTPYETHPPRTGPVSQGAVMDHSLANLFHGAGLVYAAESSDTNVMTVAVEAGGRLVMDPVGPGTAEITVTAMDPATGYTSTYSFMVTVVGAPALDADDFLPREPWNPRFTQALEVRNDSGLDAIGVRVLFTNLMPGIAVENQTGTSPDGRPMIEMQTAFSDGAALTLDIVYVCTGAYRADAYPPAIELQYILPEWTPPLPGEGTVLGDGYPLPDGRYVIQFDSVPGRLYAVEYRIDFPGGEWVEVPLRLRATANRTQWIDAGPPATQPSALGQIRAYRVKEVAE
jgi:hypothetical protein